MLESNTAYLFESKGSSLESITSSFNGPLPLIQGLRGLFWASGLGGIAVAAVVATSMALAPHPGRSTPLPVQGGASWHYSKPVSGGVPYVDRSSAPKTIIAQYETPDDSSPRLPAFDIALFNDPEYLRNLEQLYNPWLGY